jgi:cytochrome c1
MSDEAWPRTFKLTKPITVPGHEAKELRLREPTTGDLIDIGLPSDHSVMGEYISALAAVPPIVVKALALPDFFIISQAISDFFGQAVPQTAPETSPSNSA